MGLVAARMLRLNRFCKLQRMRSVLTTKGNSPSPANQKRFFFRVESLALLITVVVLSLFSKDALGEGSLAPLKTLDSTALVAAGGGQEILRHRWNERTNLGLNSRVGPSDSHAGGHVRTAFASILNFGNTQFARLLAKAKADDHLPEWLRRVDVGGRVGSESASGYIETTQPLWQTEDLSHTLFAQARATLQDGTGLYSGGLGYRKGLLNNQLVLGVNTFYDYGDRRGHARLGGGAEILSPVAEFRWNIYEPTSNARRVAVAGATETFESALAGFDLELGMPLPYFPDFKVYGKYQVWDLKGGGEDLKRSGARTEWYLTSFFRIDGEAWYDSFTNKWEHRIGLVLRGDFDTTSRGFFVRGMAEQAYKPWTEKDVRWITTYRVVREFDIVTERTSVTPTGTLTISVGRGT